MEILSSYFNENDYHGEKDFFGFGKTETASIEFVETEVEERSFCKAFEQKSLLNEKDIIEYDKTNKQQVITITNVEDMCKQSVVLVPLKGKHFSSDVNKIVSEKHNRDTKIWVVLDAQKHIANGVCSCEDCVYKRLNGNLIINQQNDNHCNKMHFNSLKPEVRILSVKRKYACEQCSYKTWTLTDINSHESEHVNLKLFSCDQCLYKTDRQVYLKNHQKKHTSEKMSPRDECLYNTPCEDYILNHRSKPKTVKLVNDKPYSCDVCSYKAQQKVHLQIHQRKHTGEKPFSCDQCSYKASRKDYILAHQRTHTGHKPFVCDICPYKAYQKVHLQVHMRTHTGEKPYTCDYCSYRAYQKVHLRVHLLSHTGQKPYACNQCSYRAYQKVHLKAHLRNHMKIY